MTEWIGQLFDHPDMLQMGHAQRKEDANLGLGWIYYALARAVRPRCVVVIGSYRGFVPIVLAKALTDNEEGGQVTFVDPSLVDGFWRDPTAVRAHFESLGVRNVQHHGMTTQEFVASGKVAELGDVGLLFVDGYHTAEQAQYDHEAFLPVMTPDALTLFHDSVRYRRSRIYGEDRVYHHTVVDYMDALRRGSEWQVFSLPHGDGLTLVSRRPSKEPR